MSCKQIIVIYVFTKTEKIDTIYSRNVYIKYYEIDIIFHNKNKQ